MRLEIDQSGKAENSRVLTVIACANHCVLSIKISAIEKRKLIHALRVSTYPRHTYVYKIFAALIFCLLREMKDFEVMVDQEYPGKSATIKNILFQLFKKARLPIPNIYFGYIGKKSRAHDRAIEVFRGKYSADKVVMAKDILRLFYQK